MPYRDDGEALEQREALLAEELDRVDTELDRLRRLERKREDLVRSLSDVRAVQRQRRVPLSNLPSASPCDATWASMDGEGRVRRCGRCGKQVYDVVSLPRSEALALIMEDEQFSDVDEARRTLRVRADGTLIAGDCPLGAHRQRRARAVVGGGLAALGLATLLSHPAHHHGGCPHSAAYGPNAVDGADAVWVELDDEIEIDTSVAQGWARPSNYVPYDMGERREARADQEEAEAAEDALAPEAALGAMTGGEAPADRRRSPGPEVDEAASGDR
jgi:hypothetical protein